MKFEFEKAIKVTTLDMKWDIYWILEDEDTKYAKVLKDCNDSLTRFAILAIEQKDADIFYKAADSLASLGAADTEPLWQFRDLWSEVYGEDI